MQSRRVCLLSNVPMLDQVLPKSPCTQRFVPRIIPADQLSLGRDSKPGLPLEDVHFLFLTQPIWDSGSVRLRVIPLPPTLHSMPPLFPPHSETKVEIVLLVVSGSQDSFTFAANF